MKTRWMCYLIAVPLGILMAISTTYAATDKPNILVIFGDDIGVTNVSAYSDGLMGYTTPHIDRVADEGIRFLHYYSEQSCTAGRAAFLKSSLAMYNSANSK